VCFLSFFVLLFLSSFFLFCHKTFIHSTFYLLSSCLKYFQVDFRQVRRVLKTNKFLETNFMCTYYSERYSFNRIHIYHLIFLKSCIYSISVVILIKQNIYHTFICFFNVKYSFVFCLKNNNNKAKKIFDHDFESL